MGVKMDLTGFKELEAELEKLSKAAGKGVLRRSLIKAAQPTAALMNSLAPLGATGNLKGSIVVSTNLATNQGNLHRKMFRDERSSVEVFVGADWHLSGQHAHLVEYGTGPRYQKKSGKFVGSMPAQPFGRPAWDRDQGPMLERLKADLWAEIQKAVARAERKAAKQARG